MPVNVLQAGRECQKIFVKKIVRNAYVAASPQLMAPPSPRPRGVERAASASGARAGARPFAPARAVVGMARGLASSWHATPSRHHAITPSRHAS